MKKLFVTIVGVLSVILTSCSEDIVFNVSMEVTPTEVRNGDKITISFIKSEKSSWFIIRSILFVGDDDFNRMADIYARKISR